ncbi:hypothetical protein REH65_32360 [Saccharopolyspora sp. ID03-671]|uniref:hypothetical protein n=1 Tax=Saccharopolyspora sp. ID03-671 TaxID=3073066 RepID=UPI00324BBDFA
MTTSNTAMAFALRSAQWKLDEAAFAAGAGRLCQEDARELAEQLAQLAGHVRKYAEAHVTIDVTSHGDEDTPEPLTSPEVTPH